MTGDSQLAALDRLVGTWRLSGGAQGTTTYRWLDGGFFLLQEFDLRRDGHPVRGIEVIGRERTFGAEEPGEDLRAWVFDQAGNTLAYVYELAGDTLTIWGGSKGSPAYLRATFSDDDTSFTGAWVWPGGGYDVTAVRVVTGTSRH